MDSLYTAGSYDVAVVGAGHAGIEAALAAARLGARCALFTLSLDLVGNMPCNPSIGGSGKGHLVFEIDALGGEMGRAADSVMLQSRMLNLSKGPAVHSLRLQADRRAYQAYMKRVIENTPGLSLVQCEITGIRVENGRVTGVESAFGAFFEAKKVIIATGTSLSGRIIVGAHSYESGPDNTVPARRLSDSLRAAGVELMRFKTGTPPRIHADSIDYGLLEEQPGDEPARLFSSGAPGVNRRKCYIAYTNEETKRIILSNLSRSPLFSGEIKGTGPRYCPSIEDKMVRFPDKERHQVFVEPMGADTKEMYLQGLSSSLPEDVQKALVRSIQGLERAEFMRTAYAIEYDCCDATQLSPTLEFKKISGLYGAGQFNGSSGYEEAAAQGLVAGINAALSVSGRGEFVLSRSDAYIGALIDDLVTKGTDEPYRIMTSRSEYRLLLRQDNAAARLTPKGREAGLIDDARWAEFLRREAAVEKEIARLRAETLPLSDRLREFMAEKGFEPPTGGIRKSELLRRPGVTVEDIYSLEGKHAACEDFVAFRAQTEIKYEGYIKKQLAQVERFKAAESKKLPPDIDYLSIRGLRTEAAQKLHRLRPESVGRASRVSGVSPADIAVLLVYLAEKYPSSAHGADTGTETEAAADEQ